MQFHIHNVAAVERDLPKIVSALRRGFKVKIILQRHDWPSESASYAAELVISGVEVAVHDHQLRQFQTRNLHFVYEN
jgi:hypothetical protein